MFTDLCTMCPCHAVCLSSTLVVPAATATTHNHGITATPAVAGTGCFFCAYHLFFSARTMGMIAYFAPPVTFVTKHTW